MSTAVTRKHRYPYRMVEGAYVREKRVDEVLNETVDFINELDSGETLSSVTVDASGPTISSETVATGRDSTNTAVTFTVTGVGYITITVVTSDTRTLERRMGWEATDNDLGDYRG